MFLKPEWHDRLDSTNTTLLERLSKGRTTLIIAPRLETVKHADQIIVMEAGRKVEAGTHDSLRARNGLYARLT